MGRGPCIYFRHQERRWCVCGCTKARGIIFVPSTFCFVRACPISLLVVFTRRYAPDDIVHAVINVKEPIAVTANYATKSNLEQQRQRFSGYMLNARQRRILKDAGRFCPSRFAI